MRIQNDWCEYEVSHVRHVGAVVALAPKLTTIQAVVAFLRGTRMLWRFLFVDQWVATLTFTRIGGCSRDGTRNGGENGKTSKWH